MKETNFNVVETGVTEYTASNGEFVKSSGDKVVLPSPEQDAIVAVRDVGQNLILETPTGLIIDEAEKRLDRSEAAYLISDGANWYTVQDSDVIRGVIPDRWVEDFEHNNLESNWDGDLNTLNAEIQSDTVFSGDYALKTQYNDSAVMEYVGSNSPPVRGETFRFYVYMTSSDHRWYFSFFGSGLGGRGPENGYTITLAPRNDDFGFTVREDGSSDAIGSRGNGNVEYNTWLEMQVETSTDGTLRAAYREAESWDEEPPEWDQSDEIESIEANDSTHDSGTILVAHADSGSAEPAYLDDIYVYE